jgi:hypothetical protein
MNGSLPEDPDAGDAVCQTQTDRFSLRRFVVVEGREIKLCGKVGAGNIPEWG